MNNYLLKSIIESKGISLNDKNLSLLVSIFVKRDIKKNEFFLKEGDEPSEVGLVLSGVFRSFYIDRDGDDITKYFYSEESLLFSYFAYLERKPSSYYIQAIEDSCIFVAKVSDFEKIVDGNYELLLLYKKLLDEVIVMKEEHACSFKLLNSRQRYEEFKKKYPGLEKRVKQHQLASYLGVTPVSLSRIKNKMKN